MISQGTDKDYLTTRVSYKLDLRGPSVPCRRSARRRWWRRTWRAGACWAASATSRSQAAYPLPFEAGLSLRGRRIMSRRTGTAALSTRALPAPSSATASALSCSSGSTMPQESRHDPCGDQRLGDQQRRIAQDRVHRAEHRRPGRGDYRRVRARRDRSGDNRLRRSARDRTALGDPVEVAPLTQAFTRSAAQAVLRDRLAEDEHRPPQSSGRRRGADQGRIGSAPQMPAATHQFFPAKSANRFRQLPLLCESRGDGLAAEWKSASGGRQLLRDRRHERPRGPGRSSAATEPPDLPTSSSYCWYRPRRHLHSKPRPRIRSSICARVPIKMLPMFALR